MSYVQKLVFRFLAASALLLAAGGVVAAAEEPRTWTNTQGKKIEGTLLEKGDGWARVEVKGAGKVYKIQLSTLSKADQEYVKNAKLGEDAPADEPEPDEPEPDEPEGTDPKPTKEPMDEKPKPKPDDPKPSKEPAPESGTLAPVVGLKVSEVDPTEDALEDTSHTAVRLKFEVKAVPESGVHCIIVWMANFRAGGGTDKHSDLLNYFPKDGEYFSQQIFSNNAQSGATYKGYAVRLLTPEHVKVAEMASESKFLEYLDDVQRQNFPESLPEKEEEE